MSYSISNLKTDLEAILHGTSLGQVQNIDPLIKRAGRQLLLDIDPRETKRLEQIDNALYDRVFEYPVPADLKGSRILDIRPQVKRVPRDNFNQTNNEYFDIYKNYQNNQFTIEDRQGVRFLRISKDLGGRLAIDEISGVTGNGTWSEGDDATNLTTDNFNYITSGASLKFDLDGSTTDGYLENTTLQSVNLETHEDESALFMWVFMPDPSIVTSVDLRWGSSSSDYWNRTVTTAQPSAEFQRGWNLLRFDWNGATETGTPDATDVTYCRATINYDGTADTDFRIDSIVSNLGEIYLIEYYSKYLYRDTSGTWLEEFTTDDDLVNLELESYNLLLYKVAYFATQQVQGANGSYDASYFDKEYQMALKKYISLYPTEAMKKREPYYQMRGPVNQRVRRQLTP